MGVLMMDLFDSLDTMLPLCEMASMDVEAPTGTIDASHYKAYAKNPSEIDPVRYRRWLEQFEKKR